MTAAWPFADQRDTVLRLFQQLHQDQDDDWHRASGSMLCPHCGLAYRFHPLNETTEDDRRLCSGVTVHL